MAPKPASTAGKAPASTATASKAPAKTTEGAKGAKKTAKTAAPADGEKKKRKKVRKETYSSYIYKGELSLLSYTYQADESHDSTQTSSP
jgi:histone H2B